MRGLLRIVLKQLHTISKGLTWTGRLEIGCQRMCRLAPSYDTF